MHILVCGKNFSRVFHRDLFCAYYCLTFISITYFLFLGILGDTLNNMINKLQERALRILYKDDASSFIDLLEKDKSITIHERNIKLLAIEMSKVKNDICQMFWVNSLQ